MKVSDVMMSDPAFCVPESNIGEAVEMLWNHNCGILPVVNAAGKVIGVITDRDVAIAMGTRGRRAGELRVGDVVPERVYTCGANEDIRAALATMARQRLRRLPVVNNQGRLEGLLSMDDIIIHFEKLAGEDQISSEEIVDTLQKIYGPKLPVAIRKRVLATAG